MTSSPHRFAARFAAPLLALALLLGCSSMPQASERNQQDLAPTTARTTGVEDTSTRTTATRPIPNAPKPERGFTGAIERGTRTASGRPGDDYWQQDVDYDLTARLFPAEKRLEGSATITYTNNAPTALQELHVELAQNLHKGGVARLTPSEVTGGVELTRVALDGRALPDGGDGPHYQTQNTQLVIQPPTPIPSGGTVTLQIDWAFTIPQAGASGRMGYSRDDLFFLAYWYPQMSVYDDVVGWMDDPFLGLAEFYSNFADYDLTIYAPDEWIVQSTGALQNPSDVFTPEVLDRRERAYASDTPVRILEPGQTGTVDAPNDTLTWRFTADQVRDVAFHLSKDGYWEGARTPAGDRDGDGATEYTQINTFWRDSAPKWAEVTRYQQHAITFFAEYMDFAYPWPHMTAVEGGGIIGGGMEFPMMTIMGDYNQRTPRMLYAVTAHELAHMWVPMIVNTNERRYSWMDEGTTSFNENMARGDFFDDSNAIESDRADYLTAAQNDRTGELMRWSNFHHSIQAFVVASYRKPATLYVALRGVLGEETFNRAFQDFIDTWAYKHPYPSDFFNTFERVSGRDLDWFWYSWYYTTWTLDQAVASVEATGDRVEITVEDRGEAPMPVPLTLTLSDGSTLERTIPVDVWLRGRTTATTTVNVRADRVERVEIDADRAFPDTDRSNNVWTTSDTGGSTSR